MPLHEKPIKYINTKESLQKFCKHAAECDFVTVDTEFYVRHTYYPKLCLIQLAYGNATDGEVGLIDPISDDFELDALKKLFVDQNIVKVFHAARQDLEIFYKDFGILPSPIFDTQIAAMACGFNESVGYDRLVHHFTHKAIDKTRRLTDWRIRPLQDRQIMYAANDVTYLREIYVRLLAQLKNNKREKWIDEEIEALLNPSLYEKKPEEAWRRLKYKSRCPDFIARIMTLATFREKYAQKNNIARNLFMRDELILEIAASNPYNSDELKMMATYEKFKKNQKITQKIMQALSEAKSLAPQIELSQPTKKEKKKKNPALATLLRVLLKACAHDAGVSESLIASSHDLDEIAMGKREITCFKGWRHDLYGNKALKLCEGSIAIRAQGTKIEMIDVKSERHHEQYYAPVAQQDRAIPS